MALAGLRRQRLKPGGQMSANWRNSPARVLDARSNEPLRTGTQRSGIGNRPTGAIPPVRSLVERRRRT
jgi:hypothetical protein